MAAPMFSYQPWYMLHCFVNRLAWRYAAKKRGHWLWRLNDRLADRYVPRYVADIIARSNAFRTKLQGREEDSDDT